MTVLDRLQCVGIILALFVIYWGLFAFTPNLITGILLVLGMGQLLFYSVMLVLETFFAERSDV